MTRSDEEKLRVLEARDTLNEIEFAQYEFLKRKQVNDERVEQFRKNQLYLTEALSNQPTIAPETLPIVRELREKLAECKPVVHAHWVRHYYDSGKQIDDNWYCSQCAMCGGKVQLCYCPDCGTKMDEVVFDDP